MGRLKRTNRIKEALDRGAPCLAASCLLDGKDAIAQEYRRQLRTGEWPLNLPEGSSYAEQLRESRSISAASFRPTDGVYALSTFDWPSGSEDGKEATARLLDVQRGTGTEWGSFAAGCERGILAAREWFYKQLGLVEITGPWHVVSSSLSGVGGTAEQRILGESAGLAAALAFGLSLVGEAGRPADARVAAVGRVFRGQVLRVEEVGIKARALLRELPGVRTLFVPEANSAEVPKSVRQQIDVVEVATVAAALKHYLGAASPEWLASLDLETAARKVQQLEIEQEHPLAHLLAQRILEQTSEDWDGPIEDTAARMAALPIEAITLTHRGLANQAVARFAEFDRGIAATPENVRASIITDKFKTLVAAKRASAWIDMLDYGRAVGALAAVKDSIKSLEPRPKVEAWGTYARALACAGDLDGAEAMSKKQLKIALLPSYASWRSQCLCNRMDVLFRRVANGEGERNDEIAQLIQEARRGNAELPEQAAKEQNETFVDLWEARLCAAQGRYARAAEIAGGLEKSAGHFPTHYMHRFVGEALTRAGLIDQGIGYLDAVVDGINPKCGPFERIILMTSAAVSAAVRIRHDQDGWLEQGQSFLGLLRGWNPGFVEIPAESDGPEAWLCVLEDALARLPY